VTGTIVNGNQLLIRALASGRDKAVPPGIAFGHINQSQMPIPRRQPTPYGAWSIGYSI